MSDWMRRYRPYLTIVVAVALVVVVPRLRNDSSSALRSGAAGSSNGGSSVNGGQQVGSTAPGAAGAGNAGGGGAGGTAADGTAAGGDPTVGGKYPGVGTPEALANPNCDPATGRVRFPSVFAAECVVAWPAGADNGGATAMGVTKDSIKIVLYENPHPEQSAAVATGASAAATGNPPTREAIETQVRNTINMWANHYELWGRTLDLQFLPWTGPGGLSSVDEASQRADAVHVANDLKPFLATSMLLTPTSPRVWATELGARGVISWDPDVSYAEAHAQAGYRWGTFMDDRLSALHIGEYVGKRLWGRPAKWSGNLGETTVTRNFGLVYDKNWDPQTFKDTLAQYAPGASIPESNMIAFDPGQDPVQMQQEAPTQIARLKQNGVNNVILVGGLVYDAVFTNAAAQQNWHPEMTITGWAVSDVTLAGQLNDQSVWRHAFGLGTVQPEVTDPNQRERNSMYEWQYGRQPELEVANGEFYLFSKDVLAAIQLAGPNLTPETFRDALFNMSPRGGRWCGCITAAGASFGQHLAGYPGDKYFEQEDMTEKWWDPNGTAANEIGLTASGRMWFVEGGKRYQLGDWPTTDPDVFNSSNAVLGYDQSPPQDAPPSYPRPG